MAREAIHIKVVREPGWVVAMNNPHFEKKQIWHAKSSCVRWVFLELCIAHGPVDTPSTFDLLPRLQSREGCSSTHTGSGCGGMSLCVLLALFSGPGGTGCGCVPICPSFWSIEYIKAHFRQHPREWLSFTSWMSSLGTRLSYFFTAAAYPGFDVRGGARVVHAKILVATSLAVPINWPFFGVQYSLLSVASLSY